MPLDPVEFAQTIERLHEVDRRLTDLEADVREGQVRSAMAAITMAAVICTGGDVDEAAKRIKAGQDVRPSSGAKPRTSSESSPHPAPVDKYPGVRVFYFNQSTDSSYRVFGRGDPEWWNHKGKCDGVNRDIDDCLRFDSCVELRDPERTAWLDAHPLHKAEVRDGNAVFDDGTYLPLSRLVGEVKP